MEENYSKSGFTFVPFVTFVVDRAKRGIQHG